MESKANIERIFDKLLAEALTSPLPKLTYRRPIKRSRLVLGSSAHASKTADSSSETSTSNVAAASKPHALVVSPASEPQALTVAAAASKPPALKVSTVSKSQALKVSGGVLKRIPTATTSVASSASFKPPAPSKSSFKKVPSSSESIASSANSGNPSVAKLRSRTQDSHVRENQESKTQDSHVRENQVSKFTSFDMSAKDASTAKTNGHVSKSIHQCTGTTINTQDVQTNENHQLFKLASSLSRTKKPTLLSHSKVANERPSAIETCNIGSAATFDGGLSSADDNSKKRALRSKNKKPTLHSHSRVLNDQDKKQQPSDAGTHIQDNVPNSAVDGNLKKRALRSRNKLSISRYLRNNEQSEQASVDCGNGSSRSDADAEAGRSSKDNDTLEVSGVEPRRNKNATVGDAVDPSPSEINNIPTSGEDPVEGDETISRTNGIVSRSADSLSETENPTLHSRRKGFDGKDVNQRPLPYDENGDDKEEENGDDDEEEEDDLPCSGHVSRPHHDDGDGEEEDDRDEISSVIDEEEEFFMHKPRPERKGVYTMKKKKLNLDALWSRIILKSSIEERKQNCSQKHKRFLHRNLQHGRYFFKMYFSRMKCIEPDKQHKLTPDKPAVEIIHDASVEGKEENNAARKRRGVKRKSMTQAVSEDVASKSNKKTRSRSHGNSNKSGGIDKASKVKGRRLNSGTRGTSKKTKGTNKAGKSAQLKSKTKQNAANKNVGRPRSGSKNVVNKKGGTVRSGSKNVVKKNVGRPRTRSQKAVNAKSAIVRSSNWTLSMPAASKKSSARTSTGLCLDDDVTMVTREQEENDDDDDIVFFDAGDDDGVNDALKSGSSKVTAKSSKGSSHFKSRVTSSGDGHKKQCDSEKNGAKKMPRGRRSHSKTKWTISDLNPLQDGVAADVMPLSSLVRASSVGSLGVEPESTDLDEQSSMSENWLTDMRPLFSSFGSRHHCGSVWKSIIDDA